MNDTVVLDGDCQLIARIDGELSLLHSADAEAGIVYIKRDFPLPVYDGQTMVEPGEDMQILRTANKAVLEDIVISPIPSNYGLITWNGATLTVS